MPLVWASRLQRTPLPERVAGSDLIWSLSAAAAERGRSVFLLGGEPGAADRAAGVLRERAPGLEIAGVECPTVEPGRDAELDAAAAHVARARPDLVYVGLPLRKQLHAVRRLRAASPRSWFLGLGASLSFVAGDTARAPVWMRADRPRVDLAPVAGARPPVAALPRRRPAVRRRAVRRGAAAQGDGGRRVSDAPDTTIPRDELRRATLRERPLGHGRPRGRPSRSASRRPSSSRACSRPASSAARRSR